MPIVEYKLNIREDGSLTHPSYIKDHDFYESNSKTFLGFVIPESERDYWVPDTLTSVSVAEAITRCITGNVNRNRAPGVADLTDAELEQVIRNWYIQHNAS